MTRYHKITCWVLAVGMTVAFGGCQTMKDHPTGTGATTGAIIGGGAGALIDEDDPFRGALIGAAVGGLVGAGVGHMIKRQKEAFNRIEELEAREQTVILQQPPAEGSGSQASTQSQQLAALMVRVPAEVLFDVGSSALNAHGANKVREMAQVLKDYPDSDVYVRGYTSSEGDDAKNFDLSQRRAEVVRNELAANGVAPSRLYAQGMGESNPVASNDTEAGRVQNRRVELFVVPRDQ
jgi:outer membrane protein OmpA-like peptidoglycan-associated protein